MTGDPVERCLEEILEDLEEEADPKRASSPGRSCRRSPSISPRSIGVVSRIAGTGRLARMAATDRSVIRLAAAELLYHVEVPVRVTLDEAIEIAKKYGMETSGAFVNGILDRLAHDVRPPG